VTARLVVTLPPGQDAMAFALRARAAGADLLELRSDVNVPHAADPAALGRVLPYLLAQRTGAAFPASWVAHASLVDAPLGSDVAHASLVSWHAAAPVTPEAAEETWRAAGLMDHVHLKHVEPLGDVANASRLFETARRLRDLFGAHRVTVLATGALALPWRAVLSRHNALEYVAMDDTFHAAVGQRLLLDAVRARRGAGLSKAIVGHNIAHSRSPRLHSQPFDRWDLPPDAPVVAIMDALREHHAGFAVTSPFKKTVAVGMGSALDAVNTVVRTRNGWSTHNTDVDGARAVLEGETPGPITVLGDGGVTAALRLAQPDRDWCVLTRETAAGASVTGTVVWTWPASVEVPPGLDLSGARVLVVAYGPPAWRIARAVRERGGEVVSRGPRWLVAQARAQRRLWESAA